MITILKLAGLSAVLSAGVVGAYEAPRAPAALSGKLYTDRVLPDAPRAVLLADAGGAAVRQAVATDAAPDCRGQAWPYVATDCVEGASARKAVRTITIERRDGPSTSTLVRLPAGPAAMR